ncbi:MAG: phosphoglycerate kinase [Patescibacteria group bacterium]|nr:phosphoglycerate kinase [Patescibacteria group bacterium]
MIRLKKIQEADVKNKTVLLRADLDIPLAGGKIADDFRLITSLETINYFLKQTKTIVIIGHLGRPEEGDKSLSLKVVAKWYAKNFKFQISNFKLKDFTGWKIGEKLILLENLRFFQGEEKNDQGFSKQLASLADIYVNDAFASSHRAHASIVSVTKYLPSFAGLRLEKEVEELSKILNGPKRPLVVIIGGAKIETKLPLVEKMHHFADYVLVGGEIAENDKVLLKVQHEKITGRKSILLVADSNEDLNDITSKSAENFVQIIQNAKTIVWNGPMGVTEEKENQNGTNILAEGIVQTSADTIVGGGDTLAFLKEKNLLDKFSFVSTGGGAMLEFLADENLPGLEVLDI